MHFTGTTVLKLKNGKIVEEVGLDDGVTALQQQRGAPVMKTVHHRNAISACIVSSGRSSMSQCPVSFKSTVVTVVATSFICWPRIVALAFSPAIDRTGMVNFAFAISAKSFAVSGHAA